METLATLPYAYDHYRPMRTPGHVRRPPSPAPSRFSLRKSHGRTVSHGSAIDDAFWELEEQQKQDRLINIILALLHI